MVSYRPLWETMKRKGITQYTLIYRLQISAAQIDRFKKNRYVSTHTIEMLCKILDCNVEEIIEITDDN